MEKAEILEKIKSFFFKEDDKKENYEEQEDEMAQTSDWKSGDTIVRVMGEVMVGTPVQEVTEGGMMDLLDGSYEIEDANITLVVADGVIAEVIENEVEEIEEPVVEDEFKQEGCQCSEKFSSEEDITNLKSEIGTIVKEAFEALTNELESIKKENLDLKTRFETFSNEDSDKSVTEGKEKKIKFEDKYEKLRYFGKR